MALGGAEISLRAIRNEFVAGSGQASLRSFQRGNASGYVRANQGDNPATNLAANVSATTYVSMRSFRSQARGWNYTNSGNLYNSSMQAYFGSDWSVDYPKTFTNNSQCLSTAGNGWGFRADGGAGTRSLINNGNILGAAGASESAAGLHALYINSTGLGVWNNSQIFAGGGGGGHGGVGGTGGGGQYNYTDREPDTGGNYSPPSSYCIVVTPGGNCTTYWGGAVNSHQGVPVTGIVVGIYTYNQEALQANVSGTLYYSVHRTHTAVQNTNGGGGGGGGTGGRGYGSDGGNAGGSGGAPGAAGGTNAGSGGYGGTGGTGGSWGAYGGTGATGATGNGGNRTGGTAGAGGTAGGPPGYYIYAQSSWAFYVNASAAGLYYSVV